MKCLKLRNMDETYIKILDSDIISKSDGLENIEVATQKYKVAVTSPVSITCNICGEKISTTQDWLLHHYGEWHRRVLKWVDTFRTKCIEQQDEDAETKYTEAIQAVKDRVQYTQELFELNGRLVCCVCACDVDDIAEHLSTTKHNESFLSIVDSAAFTKIKETCLNNNSNEVNEEFYRKEIQRRLAEELPPTADEPLEVVVLQDDMAFYFWFDTYRRSICAMVESKRLSSVETSKAQVAIEHADAKAKDDGVVFVEEVKAPEVKSQVEQPTTDNSFEKSAEASTTNNLTSSDANCCKICDLKYFSREMFMKHCKTEDHAKKRQIHDFLNSGELFVVGKEPATVQEQVDHSPNKLLGVGDIYEMCYMSTELRFWLCGVCFCGVTIYSDLLYHLQGVKHEKRYIESRYPEKKERITTKEQLSTWLTRAKSEVLSSEGKRMLKHAVVLSEIPDILKGIGISEETIEKALKSSVVGTMEPMSIEPTIQELVTQNSVSTINGEQAVLTTSIFTGKTAETASDSAIDTAISATKNEPMEAGIIEEPMPKDMNLIVIDDSTVALQCKVCWDVFVAKKKETTPKWKQHISSSDHKKKLEFQNQWNPDVLKFAQRPPSDHVRQSLDRAMKSCSQIIIVGLNELVEVYDASRANTKNLEVVCFLCTTTMNSATTLQAHMCSKNHVMKYMNKYFPEDVVKVFNGFAKTTFSEITRFLANHDVNAGVMKVHERTPTEGNPQTPVNSNDIAIAIGKALDKEPAPKPPAKTGSPKKANVAVVKKEATGKASPKKPSILDDKKGNSLSGLSKATAATANVSKPTSKETSNLPTKAASGKPEPTAGKTLTDSVRDKKEARATEAKSNCGNVKNDTFASREEDLATKLLMDSPSSMIPIRYHAFAQPMLNECKEPLVGVEEVHEFCSKDMTYEPAYICKLCRIRSNSNELIAHLTSDEHRLNYFEKKHPSIYFAITAGQSLMTSGSKNQKSVLQALAIKQHAQVIERTEGRSRISHRLTDLVDPGPYGMRRNAIAGAQNRPTTISALSVLPAMTTSLPPDSGSFGGATLDVGSAGFHSTRPTTSDTLLPPGVSIADNVTATSMDRMVPPVRDTLLPPGISASDSAAIKGGLRPDSIARNVWSAKCDRFLEQMSKDQKGISSGNTGTAKLQPTRSPVKATMKPVTDSVQKDGKSLAGSTKAVVSPIKKEIKQTGASGTKASVLIKSDGDRSKRSRSRDSSKKRTSQRRRSRSRSRSRHSRSRRRSRSRSRSRSYGKREKAERKSTDEKTSSKAKDTKRRSSSKESSKSPKKARKIPKERSVSKEPAKKKIRPDQISERGSTSGQSVELPDLLLRLAEQLSKQSSAKAKAEPAPPPKASVGGIGTLLSKLFANKAKLSASAPTANAGLGQLLTLLEKANNEPAKAAKPTSTALSDMEKLAKFVADEEEKQRRQEEQRNAILSLLSSTKRVSDAPATSTKGPTVFDYGHSSQQAPVMPSGPGLSGIAKQPTSNKPLQPNPMSSGQRKSQPYDDDDDLVQLAMRNVQRAQASSKPAPVPPPIRQTIAPTPQTPPFPFDMSRPPPIRLPPPAFGIPRPPFPVFPQQGDPSGQAAAIVNAAAAVLLSSLFNQSVPPRM